MRFRTVLADADPNSIAVASEVLRSRPEFELAAIHATGAELLQQCEALAPQLILVSVELPDVNGFTVVERLGPVFAGVAILSARDQAYANRAFELGALDFLLRPFVPARLEIALGRAAHYLRVLETARIGGRLMSALNGGTGAVERSGSSRIVVRSAGRMLLIKSDEIDWIQSEGNYVRLHTGNTSYLHRETMNNMQARLDERFLRIHRTAMVNVERIRAIRPHASGDCVVVLRDGKELPVSRGYREALRRLLAS